MLIQTEAVVIRSVKFRETSLIVTLYTEKLGLMPCLIKGIRSSKGKMRASYFFPLSVLDCVIYYKENREVQKLTDAVLSFSSDAFYSDARKSVVAFFIVEIFSRSVKEHERNESLYQFLKSVSREIWNGERKSLEILVYFLIRFVGYVGYSITFPNDFDSGKFIFNSTTGKFDRGKEATAKDKIFNEALIKYSHAKINERNHLSFNTESILEIIHRMLDYYRSRMEHFGKPKSEKILEQLLLNY